MNGSTLDMEDLARRIPRIEDRNAVSELIAHYSIAWDDRDMERFAELFTSDASVGFGDVPSVSGHAAVIKSYRRNLEQFGPSCHYPHTQTVAFQGEDEAALFALFFWLGQALPLLKPVSSSLS